MDPTVQDLSQHVADDLGMPEAASLLEFIWQDKIFNKLLNCQNFKQQVVTRSQTKIYNLTEENK